MNEVVFSDKYQPLFDLLICWDEIKRIQSIPKPTDQDLLDLRYFRELSHIDTVLISGGRDSGKSFALSTFNVVASHDFNHRILYTRQTMSSTDNSISTALQERMSLLGLEGGFESANNNYNVKGKIGKISITGQKTSVGTQTAKLKSLEDYSIFETDEGEELESYESWLKIKRSMRAKDVQCLSIISFNPPTREHWIAQEFYEGIPEEFNGIKGNILYIHTNYMDNGKENMALHNWNEYEDLRINYEIYQSTPKEQRELLPNIIIKKANSYKYDILGHFKLKAEGVIYEDWEVGKFDESFGHINGLDFGVSDPDACVKVAVDESTKRLYVKENFFQNDLSTDQLELLLNETVGKSSIIIADASGKRSIRDFWDKGFEIDKCRKGPDSVKNGIKTIKSYTIVVDPESLNVMKALNNYRWSSKQGEIPHHDWSDLMDAMRYAAIYLIEGHGNAIL